MGVLTITENSVLLTLAQMYEISVCVDDYGYDLDTYTQHPEIGYLGIQHVLREEISTLEDTGENMSNIRTVVQKVTKNHKRLRIMTSFDCDIDGNVTMSRLMVRTPQNNMISVILRKKEQL